MAGLLRAGLRTGRHVLARTAASVVATAPILEPLFVAAGQYGARRSRVMGGLYWHAHEALIEIFRRRGPSYRRVTVLGLPIDVDITDRTGRLHYFHDEPYEPAVASAIVEALRPGDAFVDVGANIGFFSILAAMHVGPTGTVLAFEPHPGARHELETLAERNGVTSVVEVVPIALADREGESLLHLEDTFTSYSTLDPATSPMRTSATFSRSITVPTSRLDAWLAARGDLQRRLRCIKIDVEGAEAAVLAGMRETLQRTRARIICETSIGSAADLALLAAGFRRHRVEPGDGAYGNHLYVRD